MGPPELPIQGEWQLASQPCCRSSSSKKLHSYLPQQHLNDVEVGSETPSIVDPTDDASTACPSTPRGSIGPASGVAPPASRPPPLPRPRSSANDQGTAANRWAWFDDVEAKVAAEQK